MPRHGEADLPREALDDRLDDVGAARLIAAARAALGRIEAGEGTLADLEAALAGEEMTPLSRKGRRT